MLKRFWLSLVCLLIMSTSLCAEIIDREGPAYLEMDQNQLILHLKGSPYDIGFQHGRLLKDKVAKVVAAFVDAPPPNDFVKQRVNAFKEALPIILAHVPEHFIQEMHGLADGSGIPYEKILLANLYPEMFHCAGLTVTGKATKNHELYHVRVLDYVGKPNLKNAEVLMVVEPKDGHTFLNVTYAGFIGVVTGMNDQKISIGEIGGLGYGQWDGMPMSFLLRELLEKAGSLKQVQEILTNTPRTCEYYYVIADGKTNQSVGFYATASQLQIIEPGKNYALMAPKGLPKYYGKDGSNDKFFLSPYVMEHSDYQTVVYQDPPKNETMVALFHKQPEDCVVLTGFPNPKRYPVLIERLMKKYGNLTVEDLQEAVKTPVTCDTNLHNAIFYPKELQIWISHPGPNGEAASSQSYSHFSLSKLSGS